MRFIGVYALMPTTMGLSIELPSELKTDYMPLSFEEGGDRLRAEGCPL